MGDHKNDNDQHSHSPLLALLVFRSLVSLVYVRLQVIPILQDSSEAMDQLIQIRIIFPQDVLSGILHRNDSVPHPVQPQYVGKSTV